MKLTIVVVLYKQAIEQSKTFRTLKPALFSQDQGNRDAAVILYDNSPEKQVFDPAVSNGIPVSYIHDPRNLGIATAYNYAWNAARENGSEWLLLLDHDTEITAAYMEQVLNLGEKDEKIAAVVPKINSEGQMISPVYSHSLRPLHGPKPKPGLQEKPVMAINSGALVRVQFLNEIGGFNEDFPLDYLDHWLFYMIYTRSYQVWLLDVSMEHELSVMDYSRVSLERYKSILESEIEFYKNYQQDLFKPYRMQLFKRFIKQAVTVKNKKIAFYTLRKLLSM